MGEYFAERGTDYHDTGWITDSGEFIACSCFDHDKIAEEKTGLTVAEVEKKWIRIGLLGGKNFLQYEGKKMNRDQHAALDKWGLNELLKKGRIEAPENFIEAYFK